MIQKHISNFVIIHIITFIQQPIYIKIYVIKNALPKFIQIITMEDVPVNIIYIIWIIPKLIMNVN